MKPQFSIIIPLYNTDVKLFKRCLNSILELSFNNFECIIVDDGSKNHKLYEKEIKNLKDNRFKYFLKDNGGAGQARDFGLSKSSGNYIWFVDSDDYLLNQDCLNIFNHIFETNDIDLIWFQAKKSNGNKSKTINDGLYQNIYNKELWVLFDGMRYTWNCIYKKSFLVSNNICNLKNKVILEDVYWDLLFKNYLTSFYVINDYFYFYDESITTGVTNTNREKKIFPELFVKHIEKAHKDLLKQNKLNEIFYFHVSQYYWWLPLIDYNSPLIREIRSHKIFKKILKSTPNKQHKFYYALRFRLLNKIYKKLFNMKYYKK